MRHNKRRRRTENLPNLLLFINKHAASATAHEEFHARTRCRVKMLNLFDVVACSPKIKAVVNMASRLGKSITFLQELKRSRLRHDVWHIENRCHTASASSPRLALHRSLMRQTRLSHVNVTVNDARQQEEGLLLLFLLTSSLFLRTYLRYPPIFNKDGRLIALALIDNSNILYEEPAFFHLLIPLSVSSRRLVSGRWPLSACRRRWGAGRCRSSSCRAGAGRRIRRRSRPRGTTRRLLFDG